MPYYESSQEWLRQSALLIEARPSTTRITTNYHLTDKTGSSKKRQKRRQQALEEAKQQQQQQQSSTTTTTTTTTPAQPRASLTIKTYDPCSGACLKYRTTKAAEVSRLILSIGQLGRKMAALPADTTTDVAMADAVEEVVGTPGVEKVESTAGAAPVAGGSAKTQAPAQGQGQTGGGGGKGKKKRGKK
ncbi:hypothetical protein F5B22DRAFT_436184 [Xylaria bambusicola]|uniref:uncharacterized protein n=1 Tax=Xylaria bambusicola TaxID=326684 RepID=UPI0020077500|nr:uncharacterized protein F5B22DRAFT_436184 [Xylaria bambusicola]KAI0506757.1 hypothetical protein F5B22DRAFT_436184 [Xylaria bambusicola]